jgi:hypothetical protein
MLRSFRVSNHRSIRAEVELSLLPAYDKSRTAVPVAGVFGANASGKSNLLDAMSWMREAVLHSFGSWTTTGGVPRKPFRLDPSAAAEPSTFAVELMLDDVRYVYGFVVDDDRITEEWLHYYPQNRKRVVFDRNGPQWTFGTSLRHAKAEIVRELTRENALFLSAAGRSDLEPAAKVFRWFELSPPALAPGNTLDTTRLSAFLDRSDRHRRTLVDLLRLADLGIQDLVASQAELTYLHDRRESLLSQFTDAAIASRDAQETLDGAIARLGHVNDPTISQLVHSASRRARDLNQELSHIDRDVEVARRAGPKLSFVHGPSAAPMSTADQSNGTLAWLRLLVPSLTALENGSVLCVDEIDASLHPRLTARLIELFQSPETNPSGAQLLFTTHDATLLGTSFGQDILTRDEVWFVEKDKDGATKLFPLTDFHPRKEENTERRYLGGSYGAVPDVSAYEFGLAARGDSDAA